MQTNTTIIVIARILIALVFIPSGLFKLISNPETVEYMSNVGGLPGSAILSWVVGVLELAAGIAIVVGYRVKLFAAGLAVHCIATAVLFHAGVGAQAEFSDAANAELVKLHWIMVMKNLSMSGGLLLLVAWGAGPASLDARRNSNS